MEKPICIPLLECFPVTNKTHSQTQPFKANGGRSSRTLEWDEEVVV